MVGAEFASLFLEGHVESNSFWEWHEGWHRAAQAHPSAILWVSFEEMKTDLEAVASKVACFLGLGELGKEERAAVARRCGFGAMKEETTARDQAAAKAGAHVKKGHMREGKVGGWRATLRPQDVVAFDAKDDALAARCGLRLHG